MSRSLKFLIGIAAVALMSWIHFEPLGNGKLFLDSLEQQARAAVASTELRGVEVRIERDPPTRRALLSGVADQFQREGQGELPGLNDLVGGIEGISGVKWTDETSEQRVAPLIAEILLLALGAYLIGIFLGWLFFGRAKKEGYLS